MKNNKKAKAANFVSGPQRGIFKIHKNVKDGKVSYCAFRNGFRLVINNKHENYKLVDDGQFWLLEYVETIGKNSCFAMPLEQPALVSSVTVHTNEGYTSTGMKVVFKATTGETRLAFLKVFPHSRDYNEMEEKLIAQKCKDVGIESITKEIQELYKENLEELRRLENEAYAVVKGTVNKMKAMQSEKIAGPYKYYSANEMEGMVQERVDPFAELPEVDALVEELTTELELIAYDANSRKFVGLQHKI
jgi:hypothetical protein